MTKGLPSAFMMELLSPGISNLIMPMEFSASFTGWNPQAIIKTVMIIKGDQALKIWPAVYSFFEKIVWMGSSLKRQIDFGFQYFNRIIRQRMEAIPASTSGSIGPM